MAGLADARREAQKLLAVEAKGAWAEYLESCRHESGPRYEEVEPWAWSRLKQRLRAIAARERQLKP